MSCMSKLSGNVTNLRNPFLDFKPFFCLSHSSSFCCSILMFYPDVLIPMPMIAEFLEFIQALRYNVSYYSEENGRTLVDFQNGRKRRNYIPWMNSLKRSNFSEKFIYLRAVINDCGGGGEALLPHCTVVKWSKKVGLWSTTRKSDKAASTMDIRHKRQAGSDFASGRSWIPEVIVCFSSNKWFLVHGHLGTKWSCRSALNYGQRVSRTEIVTSWLLHPTN